MIGKGAAKHVDGRGEHDGMWSYGHMLQMSEAQRRHGHDAMPSSRTRRLCGGEDGVGVLEQH